MADMVLVGGVCQSCPESSTRDLSDNPDECVCVGNTVTASGSSTTTTDDCTGIVGCQHTTVESL